MSDQAPDYQALADELDRVRPLSDDNGMEPNDVSLGIQDAAAALRQAASLQVEVEKLREAFAGAPLKNIQELEAKLTRYAAVVAEVRSVRDHLIPMMRARMFSTRELDIIERRLTAVLSALDEEKE
jgi:hypothetical protein